jgi:hypothetical protein
MARAWYQVSVSVQRHEDARLLRKHERVVRVLAAHSLRIEGKIDANK